MQIVPLYAAALSLLFVFLSVRIIRLRRTLRIGIGHADNKQMLRAQRVHANFAEYVPLTLLLLAFVEMQNAHAILVHLLCAVFLIARCLHAYGLSQTVEDFRFRTAGMVITFTVVVISAIYLLSWLILGLM